MDGLTGVREVAVTTPFGKPSDRLVRGKLGNSELVFLPRHGKGHRWLPTEVNFRANIFAMKKLGVERIISVSAVGSLRQEVAPGHLVVPDQFIDRTSQRPSTFFGKGLVAHVSLAEPFCKYLSGVLAQSAQQAGATVHRGGTYVCMEGPQFSTKAESKVYRSLGFSVIGMTNVPECKLAREAEICYASVALVTDYDVWHEEHVTVEMVIGNLNANTANVKKLLNTVVTRVARERRCECASALQYAIITDRRKIPPALKKSLKPIIGRYVQ
jgi:5'-methylthioadenosine phosphorylase